MRLTASYIDKLTAFERIVFDADSEDWYLTSKTRFIAPPSFSPIAW